MKSEYLSQWIKFQYMLFILSSIKRYILEMFIPSLIFFEEFH